MAFSILTSALHIAFSVQSGVVEGARSTDEYQLAKARYEAAVSGLSAARSDFSGYQAKANQGTVDESGWMLRDEATAPFRGAISGAQSELDAAQAAFEQAKQTGGAEGQIIGTVAGWFGLTPNEFALRFSIFTVVLMELARLYLSWVAGRMLRDIMAEREQETAAPVSAPARQRGRGPRKLDAEEQALDAQLAMMERDLDGGGGGLIRGDFTKDRKAPVSRTMAAASDNDAVVTGDAPKPRKAPADRTPATQRQAAYSKRLSLVKTAIKSGELPAGKAAGFDKIRTIAGGGSRDTITAIRNDVAASGLAHWAGSRLIIGPEPA